MSKVIGFYHPHARVPYTGELVNPRTGEVYTPPSMTKQEFKRECDINNIIKDFQVTGMVTHINARAQQGAYLDLPSGLDFQASVALVAQARESFMSLPSKIRDRFGNDPAQFLNFLSDPSKLAESYELGIRVKPRAQEAPPAPSPAPSPPSPAPSAPAPAPTA